MANVKDPNKVMVTFKKKNGKKITVNSYRATLAKAKSLGWVLQKPDEEKAVEKAPKADENKAAA